ncbi:hypothetical protein NA57DRAFT_61232 [Rhizodiscina lignyota]|uniref:Uncharacterized protein n=1 Tax=Rhizodiscina lignyota TaxID=1504668 RepID=A0A9P4I2V0_9PEZI|nr:hypothetical protein NA57DRAFT_61232 [Rhizodiscina lignyota]
MGRYSSKYKFEDIHSRSQTSNRSTLARTEVNKTLRSLFLIIKMKTFTFIASVVALTSVASAAPKHGSDDKSVTTSFSTKSHHSKHHDDITITCTTTTSFTTTLSTFTTFPASNSTSLFPTETLITGTGPRPPLST